MKQKIISLFLVFVLLISIFSCFTINVSADSGGGGGASFGTSNYCTPDGYTNVTVISGYNNMLIIFSKPEDTITGDGNGNFTTANKDTGESSDYYYITSSENNDWSACNDLHNKEKVDTAKLTTKTGGYYYDVLAGEIEGNIRNGSNGKGTKGIPLYSYLDRHYYLTKTGSDYNTYEYYNRPQSMSIKGEYVIFKRTSDSKYIVMFYDTEEVGAHENENYLKVGVYNEGTIRVNQYTQFAQFDTVQQCLDYLFDDTEISQKAKKYPISQMPTSSGLSSHTDRIIGGFDGSEEIINSTIDILNSDESVRHFANPASYGDWYYSKYGEEYGDSGYKMVGDYYFIYRAPALKRQGLSNVIDLSLPQDADGWTYVLVSSKTDNGGIVNAVGSTLIQMLLNMEYPIVLDGLIPKYALFNTTDDSTTAYYFSSLEKAIDFTLYGSKAAEPKLVKNMTWCYNIAEVYHNNYWLGNDKWGVNPIPEHLYKDENKVEIHLKQWNSDYKIKILIENYQPYGVLRTSTHKLQISTSQTVKFYQKYDGYDWELLDIENVSFNPYKLQLYFKGMADTTGSWEIIYSSITIDTIINSDGTITVDEENATVVEYEATDGSGDNLTLNYDTGKGFVNGEHKYNYDEEKQQWVDKDTGEPLNPDEWHSDYEEWLENRDMNIESDLKKLNNVLQKFLEIFRSVKEQTSEITGLLRATFGRLPKTFSILIGIALLAIILKRLFKRGE